MKETQTTNVATARQTRKRVKSVQRKARFAGVCYLLGTLVLAVLAFMPFTVRGTEWSITSFIEPFKAFSGGTVDYIAVATAAFYALAVLITVVNFLRACGKVRKLTKGSRRATGGANRNVRAMEKMGKIFSGSFGGVLNLYVLIALLHNELMQFSMISYGLLAAALLFHFVAGIAGGKVSYFSVTENQSVVEEKRTGGLFVYFFRNLVQIAAAAALVYFLLPICEIAPFIVEILESKSISFSEPLKTLVPVALQLAIVLSLLVMIRHAAGSTEFNFEGIDGAGMKNYRVFSLFVCLLALAWTAIEYVNVGAFESFTTLYVAGIALVAFLIDCIFKTRVKKEKSENDADDECELRQPEQAAAPVQNAQPPVQIYNQLPPQQPTSCPPQGMQQPLYVPVYFYPQCMPTPMPMQPPAPAFAPFAERPEILPAPASVAPAPAALEGELENQEEDGQEEIFALNPDKTYTVRCPKCGKELSVKDTSPYHRCPACGKVFQLRKFRAYVQKD